MNFIKGTAFRFAVAAVISAVALSSCSKSGGEPQPEPQAVKFMVLADLHYMHPDILKKEGKAFDVYNEEECKLLRESGALLDALMERVRSERPSFVIVCGDLTKDGEVICHEYVSDIFGKLENETGTKVLVVPGNHDMNNPHSLYYDGDATTPAETADEEQFARIHAGSGFDEAVGRRAGSLDYMAYPADGIAFIGVDSNEKNTKEKVLVQGGLSKEQVKWIQDMAAKAHADGRYVIMSMHHNLVDFYDNAQLIRGANIANARYEYDNKSLIDDLCAAGIDVVFSGHSHMHSITRAFSGSRTIYSVVTSSMVNLPLAYRTGFIDPEGRMTLHSGDLKDCKVPGCADLVAEGNRYWNDLSAFYMKEAADKAWDSASFILKSFLDFESKEALHSFLTERFFSVFNTFLLRTSDGNEHLFSPEANYKAARDAIDGLLDFFEDKGASGMLDAALNLILGSSIEEVRKAFSDFFHSAYFNYLGYDEVLPDDAIVIQMKIDN